MLVITSFKSFSREKPEIGLNLMITGIITVMKIQYLLTAIILAALPFETLAETFIGKTVAILDGDTLIVLLQNHNQVRVRLAEIDAPEKSQPFGQVSKQSLSEICYGKDALIEKIDTDRYGRSIANVKCGDINANQEQVKKGLAWAYVKYVHDKNIFRLEQLAKNTKVGLWAESNPIPPWEWRHNISINHK